jgi:simple sugar transport system permease protein
MASALVFGFFDAVSNIMATMRIPDEFVKLVPYIATVTGLVIFSAFKLKRSKAGRQNVKTRRE